MPSIQQIIQEVVTIKHSSDELSQMIGAASKDMGLNARTIAGFVQGSATGQQAVAAVNAASRSLADAATSMAALSHTCDDCATNLAQ